MGKRNSTWVSPKKQKVIDEQNRSKRKRNVIIIIAASVLLAALIGLGVFGIVMASRPYYAYIEIDGYGTLVIALDDNAAPNTVDAFVELAESGYYNGTSIYRAIKDAYIQGGFRDDIVVDPIKGEFSMNGYEYNTLSHIRGTIVMSRKSITDADKKEITKNNPNLSEEELNSLFAQKAAEYYDTCTGQFFILQRDKLDWDGGYAPFGTVISGMEIVDKICNTIETESKTGEILEENRPIIKSIRIERSYK